MGPRTAFAAILVAVIAVSACNTPAPFPATSPASATHSPATLTAAAPTTPAGNDAQQGAPTVAAALQSGGPVAGRDGSGPAATSAIPPMVGGPGRECLEAALGLDAKQQIERGQRRPTAQEQASIERCLSSDPARRGLGANPPAGGSPAGPASAPPPVAPVVPTPTVPAVTVTSASPTIRPGGSVKLSATLDGKPTGEVAWTVQEGADGGSVTVDGIFTAPSRMGVYHVTAASRSDPTKSGKVAMTVTDKIEVGYGVALDFSETQFLNIINVNAGNPPDILYRAIHRGPSSVRISASATCNGLPAPTDRLTSQQSIVEESKPGDSVFFKRILDYHWCKGLPRSGPLTATGYEIGSAEVQKLDITVTVDPRAAGNPPASVTVPLRFVVSKLSEVDLPSSGNARIVVLLKDETGRGLRGDVTLSTGFGRTRKDSDDSGTAVFNVPEVSEYWVWSDMPGFDSTTVLVDGSSIQPSYTLTVRRRASWNASAELLATVKGKIGFWRSSASKDGSRILLANGMEQWPDPSLAAQSKAYLLDTQTGATLWTHDLGFQSWSSDLSDDGRYAVVATSARSAVLPDGPTPFVRLLDARDGAVLWTKPLDSSEFPAECRSRSAFASQGVKFSHDARRIFVGMDDCDRAYLLNAADGTIVWQIVAPGVREIIFSASDGFVYFGFGGYARKISTADGSEVWRQFTGPLPFVNGFDLSSDEKHLCVGTKSGDLTLLNASTGAVVFHKNWGAWVAQCRFAPDGKSLLGGGAGGVILYDLSGEPLWFRSIPRQDIRFSPDERWLIGGADHAGIYDVKGNAILEIVRDGRSKGIKGSHVSWLNNNATRYVYAVQDYDSRRGDGDIIQVYSLKVTPP